MMKFPEVVRANIEILEKAGIKFSTNLDQRACCGGPAFNIRDLGTAKRFADLNEKLIETTGAKMVVSDCPGCVLTLTKRYESLGIKSKTKIIHITEFIAKLIEDGKLIPKKPINISKLTIHDPCLISRNLNDNESIRKVLNLIPGLEIREPMYNKDQVHCCGWSGTAHWADKDLSIKEAKRRILELKETGSVDIISACPLCELGLNYGITEDDKDRLSIHDVSEILAKSL